MILVTGGTGMLGAHLLLELTKSESRIRAIKRTSSHINLVEKIFSIYDSNASELLKKIEWVNADLLDYDALGDCFENIDLVYHCAGFVSYQPKDKDLVMKINIEGTANMVNLCLDKKIKKLCHVSSIAALGVSANGELIDEETYWQPDQKSSVYTQSKYYSEIEVWRGIAEGLNAVIVNPAVILGVGNWNQGSAAIFQKMWEGLRFYTKGVTGFVDVRDVCKAMTMLMNSEFSSQRYVVSAENISWKQMFGTIAKSLNKQEPSIYANPLLTGLAWRGEKLKSMLSGKSPLITKETARTSHKQLYYSNTKICNAIPINFTPINDTISQIAKEFLNEKEIVKID
jgi:nucleoside-diphosphate-sugar epimerase